MNENSSDLVKNRKFSREKMHLKWFIYILKFLCYPSLETIHNILIESDNFSDFLDSEITLYLITGTKIHMINLKIKCPQLTKG